MSELNRLRELAVLFRPKAEPITEAKTFESDFNGIMNVVRDAVADLYDNLGEGGKLETLFDKYGLSDETKKDGMTILESFADLYLPKVAGKEKQYQKEIERLNLEVEIMGSSLPGKINEMAAARKFTSGMFKSRQARELVAAFKAGEETFDLSNGEKYKAVRQVAARQLAKGMIVLGSYNRYNQGAQLYEILGFTDNDEKYGDGGVKFDSLAELMKVKGVKSLKELEAEADKHPGGYGHGYYMVVKDLEDNDSGPWFYIDEGRWVRGSGAEPVSFTLVEKA
jgi:hypothetical protein